MNMDDRALPIQQAIRFPMLQLNDVRVQRIIHGGVGYLDFKGLQALLLCGIILQLYSTPRGSHLKFAGAKAHGKTAHVPNPYVAGFLVSTIADC